MKKIAAESFRIIADEATMGFFLFEKETCNCVYANKLGREMLEIFEDSQLDSFYISSLSPKRARQEFRSFTEELFNHDGLYQDILIQKMNGMNLVANLGVKSITIEAECYLLLMIQDITLQKKLQKELSKLSMVLLTLNQ